MAGSGRVVSPDVASRAAPWNRGGNGDGTASWQGKGQEKDREVCLGGVL